MEKTYKSYELFLHFKQGDDFHQSLEQADGDIPAALRNWAEFMRGNAEHCDQLANTLEREIADGAKIEVDANTHHIGFYGDEEVLQRLADEKLLDCNVYEEK